VTGAAAETHAAAQERALREAAAILKANPAELPARVAALVEDRRRLERELGEARRQLARGGPAAESDVRDVSGIKLAARAVGELPAKELRVLAEDMRREIGSGVVALISSQDGKASIVVAVTDDLAGRVSAVDLVQRGAAALGGTGGGGRPTIAQAGGPDPSRAGEALTAIEGAIAERVGAAA
jgi:alanyl-tRNA synthetase